MQLNNYTYKNKSPYVLPCKISIKILTYGFFAVLCQLSMMLLRLNVLLTQYEPSHLYGLILPEFEYPIINIALIIGGAYFIDMLFIRSSQ